jgi:hypothetical protein
MPAGKAIDPTRVTIQLVDNSTTEIIQDGEVIAGGEIELLPRDISAIGVNTIHEAMLFLRDQVLNPTHDVGCSPSILSLSAASSVNESASPFGKSEETNRSPNVASCTSSTLANETQFVGLPRDFLPKRLHETGKSVVSGNPSGLTKADSLTNPAPVQREAVKERKCTIS